jgi:hypothetical protein
MKNRLPRERRGYAVSPAIGPLPAIFVPVAPGQESPDGRSGRTLASGMRPALRRAARRLRRCAHAGRRPHRIGG